jgi:cytochrome c peroxidase
MILASRQIWFVLSLGGLILVFGHADGQQTPPPAAANPYLKGSEGYDKGPRGLTSYQPIAIDQPFADRMAQEVAAKPAIEREHQALLEERYDLGDHPAHGASMDRGKPLQEGVRVKLPTGTTWEQLAAMTPEEIRGRGLWPQGFLPLPHPVHSTGGFVFPQNLIDATKRQEGRDLTRFDISFDLPERFLAEFPPAMYLVQRPDLGDVSQGKLISLTNYFEMFNGILTPRQLEACACC